MDTLHFTLDPQGRTPDAVRSAEELYTRLTERGALRTGCTVTIDAAADCGEELAACRQLAAFLQIYQQNKQRLNDKMEQYNTNLAAQYADTPYIGRSVQEFTRMNRAGKFLRGALVNIGYSLFAAGDAAPSDALAMAFELFQTAILIHDDIIDHAKLRRGQPTIHEAYTAHWAQRGIAVSALGEDTARSLALCTGDIGMYLAGLHITEAYADSPQLGAIMAYFHKVVLKTLYGEVIDVALPFSEQNRMDDTADIRASIMEIYRLKTAWYTLIGPLCLGAMLAGADAAQIAALEQFAEQLGIAFQIKDDILGVFGDAETGKDVGSDVSEYKQTLLYAYVREHGEKLEELLQYYGKAALSAADLHAVQEIFRSTGALAFAEREMHKCFASARAQLANMAFLQDAQRDALLGLELFIRLRKS